MILVRSVLFNIVMFGSGALFSLFGLVVKRVAPSRVLAAGMVWARFVLWVLALVCDIRLEVTGAEHLPKQGRALIAAQHQSAFDTLVWLTLLPHTSYVLKAELLKLPMMGKLLMPAGFIAVDRSGGAVALRQLVVDCRRAAKAEKQIVIFPEGTRVAPGTRGELLPGVVAVAHSLNLPVIPVATDSGLHWGRNAFKKYPGRVKVRVYSPLPVAMSRAEIISRLTTCYYETGVDNSVGEVSDILVN